MAKIFTASQMKKIDGEAIAHYGIDGLLLMEHAAIAVKNEIVRTMGTRGGDALVLCGKGNNGGDGFAVARLLCGFCDRVSVAFFEDAASLSGDAKKNYEMAEKLGLPIINDFHTFAQTMEGCRFVVDALYGFGFHGDLRARDLEIVEAVRASGKYVFSVDIPSGLCADDGSCKVAIRADKTITFTGYKPAQLQFPAAHHCGETVVADIGIPTQVTDAYGLGETIGQEFVCKNLPKRARNAHKGSSGKILVVGGSRGMAGAVCLSARAALRSGAGLVTVGVPAGINDIVQQKITEAMTLLLPEDEQGILRSDALQTVCKAAQNCDTIIFGPGIGRSEAVIELLRGILQLKKRVVLDADGLYALSRDVDMLQHKKAEVVLTPHHAEMARLIGKDAAFVEGNSLSVAVEFAGEHNVTIVLKGAYTVVAGDGNCYVNNNAGNPGMATGGSGDVLSGVVGALLCNAADNGTAAACAVYLHALAGDAVRDKFGMDAMTAGDIVEALPVAFQKIRG